MSKRYICFQDAVRLILAERDKIPETVPGRGYEFHLPQPNHSGNLIRGGIRKSLKVLETMPKADAVEVVRCRDCIHFEEYEPGFTCCGSYFIGLVGDVDPDDYCSRGERRETKP